MRMVESYSSQEEGRKERMKGREESNLSTIGKITLLTHERNIYENIYTRGEVINSNNVLQNKHHEAGRDILKLKSKRNTLVGLGGLGLTCSPRDPRFAGSNPAEVDGFFRK